MSEITTAEVFQYNDNEFDCINVIISSFIEMKWITSFLNPLVFLIALQVFLAVRIITKAFEDKVVRAK